MLDANLLMILIVLMASSRSRGANEVRKVVIQPQLAQRNIGGNLDVVCRAGTPISACQFRVQVETEVKKTDLSPLDFGLGPASPPPRRQMDDVGTPLFDAAYHGAGLDAGECGMTLANLTAGRYFVGCRVRSGDSAWMDDYMALVVHTNPISRTVESNKTIDTFLTHVAEHPRPLPTILFTADSSETLSECKFFFPHQRAHVLLPTVAGFTMESTPAHDVSMQGNQCSVTLRAAATGTSGLLWCLYRISKSSDFKMFAPRVIVLLERPKVSLNATTGNVTVGDTFKASCVVASARPRAIISWTLGGQPVRDDRRDDNVTSAWTWPWGEHSITQTLRHKLRRDELGTNVTCHVSQPGGESVNLVAVVHRDPRVCLDGYLICNWLLVLLVIAAVIACVAIVIAIVVIRLRRDWRWS